MRRVAHHWVRWDPFRSQTTSDVAVANILLPITFGVAKSLWRHWVSVFSEVFGVVGVGRGRVSKGVRYPLPSWYRTTGELNLPASGSY